MDTTGKVIVGAVGVGLVATGIVLLAKKSSTATLNGTVISAADGSAIVGASVSDGKQTATTGAGGKFTMKGLPTGSNSIGIAASGFDTYAKTLTLVAGNNTQTFVMTKTGTALAALVGIATDRDAGTPLAGVTITVLGKSAQTAADGSYTISGLAVGLATLKATLSGYAPVTQSQTLNVGQNTWNVSLTNRGTIGGTVRDSVTQTPIAGATVVGSSTFKTTTNGNGVYQLKMPDTITSVTISATGYQTQTQPVTIQPDASIPLDIELVKNFYETGTVSGIVTNSASGQVLAGANIVFSPGQESVQSDANGHYSIDLPTGPVSTTYQITVNAAGFNQWTGSIVLTIGSFSTKNISMTPVAVAPGSVSGGVYDNQTSFPIVGAQINLAGYSGNWYTDSNGIFQIPNVPPGAYTIWAAKSGYAQKSQNIPVTSGQNTTLSFGLDEQVVAIGFEMAVDFDPTNYPTAVYWYADINGLIFAWFLPVNGNPPPLWNGQSYDMSADDFKTQTLTVELYDQNYALLVHRQVPLGGAAGPLVINDHIYSFNVDQAHLYDEGLL